MKLAELSGMIAATALLCLGAQAQESQPNPWAEQRLDSGDSKWEATFRGPGGKSYRQVVEVKGEKVVVTTYSDGQVVYAREEEGKFESVNGLSVYTARKVRITAGNETGRTYHMDGGALSMPAKPVDKNTIILAVGFNFFDDIPPGLVTFKRVE